MNRFYAHISEDGKRKQTVKTHSKNVATIAAESLKNIGLYNTAYLCGIIHDMGKYTKEFQEYLFGISNKSRGSVIHTFQAHNFILNNYSSVNRRTAEIIAFVVGSHHGLFDCYNEFENGFEHRLNSKNINYDESVSNFSSDNKVDISDLFSKATEEITVIENKLRSMCNNKEEGKFLEGLLHRLLVSAITYADAEDTHNFMITGKNNKLRKLANIDWKKQIDYFNNKISKFKCEAEIDKARSYISNVCEKTAKKGDKIYNLCVPTGSGKTLSSLRFALTNALKNNKKRIIYCAPMLSILEQNAEEIKRVTSGKNTVLEHHSNVVYDTEEEKETYKLRTQDWNAPIIVTTTYQLLCAMFGGNLRNIRKFKDLSDSVIIIDESHKVPLNMVHLFNSAVSFLSEMCNSTIVLCSATQLPNYEMKHKVTPEPTEILPYDEKIWSVFKRTHFVNIGTLSIDDLCSHVAKRMNEVNSLLVVCNTKRDAEIIYRNTTINDCKKYHLSADMCAQHRLDTINEIRKSLKNKKEKVLCISTQVIEAGVDISFEGAIRELAGIDSILQTAGRCNRHGENKNHGKVEIVNVNEGGNNISSLREISVGATSMVGILSSDSIRSVESNDVIANYYNLFFNNYCTDEQGHIDTDRKKLNYITDENDADSKNLYNMMGVNELNGFIPQQYLTHQLKTSGELFKVYPDATSDVIVPYGKGKELINKLINSRTATSAISIIDKLNRYTVGIYGKVNADTDHRARFNNLLGIGAIMRYNIPNTDEIVYILNNMYYSNNTGVIDMPEEPFIEV